MMTKPQEWDNVEAIRGGGKRLTAGGHVCKILNVGVQMSRAGNEMLVILFDIAGGEFDGYYMSLYNRNKQSQGENAKYPNGGIYRQVTGGESMGRFKGMLMNIEESNPGYKWDWNEQSLKGKVFGGVFREEEYQANDGSIKTRISCIAIRPVEGIEDIPVPTPKKLTTQANHHYGDEEIPF